MKGVRGRVLAFLMALVMGVGYVPPVPVAAEALDGEIKEITTVSEDSGSDETDEDLAAETAGSIADVSEDLIAYQVSGNELIHTNKPGVSFNLISTKPGTDMDAQLVWSDENGDIAIDPSWLGSFVELCLKSEEDQLEPGPDPRRIYMPLIRFVDEKIRVNMASPRAGDEIVSVFSTNVEGVSADLAWKKTKGGETTEIAEGERFEQDAEYSATVNIYTDMESDYVSVMLDYFKEFPLQFMAGYEILPYVAGAEVGGFTPMKESLDDVQPYLWAGSDNYIGFSVEAYFGRPSEVVSINSVVIEDWEDFEWTENRGEANTKVFKGHYEPADAEDKLTVSLVDTIVDGVVIAGVSGNAVSDNVVESVEIAADSVSSNYFTITVKGSSELYKGGFATLHLDTEDGGNAAVLAVKDVLVTVRYADIGNVSINNTIEKRASGARYSTMTLSGLDKGQLYSATVVSDNKAENFSFLAGLDGTYTDKRFKNAEVSINRCHEKAENYVSDDARAAAWKGYTALCGKGKHFSVSECAAEKNRGLFYEIEGADEIYYTGTKLCPIVHVYEDETELTEGQHFTVSYKNNKDAGVAKAVIKGKNGSNVEKTELQFEIKQADIADAEIVAVLSVKGKAGKQPVVVYNGLKMVQKKTFNKLSKADLKAAVGETKSVEITGTGNFTGTTEVSVIGVTKKPNIGGLKLNQKKFEYAGRGKGEEIKAQVSANVRGYDEKSMKLVFPDDEAFRQGQAGSYKLAVCGLGEKEGFVKFLAFKITPHKGAEFKLKTVSRSYEPRGVVLDEDEYELTGVGNEKLIRGLDYTIAYTKNTKVGTAKVTVSFMGSYKGTKKAYGSFSITAANIADACEEFFAAPAANEKKAKKNTVYIVDDGVLLKKGKKADYNVNYLGKGEMEISGTQNYTGTVKISFSVAGLKEDISKAKLKAKGEYYYNGSAFTDTAEGANKVSITCTKSPAEFRFFNNINKGKAVCVAYGDGSNSTGSKAVKFKIKGAKTPEEMGE